MSDIAPNERDAAGCFMVESVRADEVQAGERVILYLDMEPITVVEVENLPEGILITENHDLVHGYIDPESSVLRVVTAAHPVPAPDTVDRTNLARALGLAQAIARAKPYPVEMDGVRAVAGEIVTLLEGVLEKLQR